MSRDGYGHESRLIHGRMKSFHWNYKDHIVPPVSASSAFRLESVERGGAGFTEFASPEVDRQEHDPIYIYERLDEPSRGMLEENLAVAERGECCVTFATGMAAISAALGVLLRTGDTVVAHRALYGCTDSLLANWYPRLGIEVILTDFGDVEALEQLLEANPSVRAVYCETPTNPNLEILDLAAIAGAVEAVRRRHPERRIDTVVDNTFATPFCQRPIEHGIDVVVHSLTKNLGGFGTDMGGAVIAPRRLESDLLLYRKDFGGVLSPKAAWPILVYGLPTLAVRLRRQMTSALEVARFLEAHPAVDHVIYPGLESHPKHELARRQMRDFDGEFAPGSLISFVLAGSPEEARERGARLMNHLADHALTITLAVSLGQVRTLIEHPASMTHAPIPPERQAAAGIEPGGIRLSLGLEDPADLLRDLGTALAVARNQGQGA